MILEHAGVFSISVFYGLHLIASSFVAGICTYFIKRRYDDKWMPVFAFFLLFNLALPLISYIFSIWLMYYLLNVKYAKVLKHTKSINMEELDQEFPQVKRAFGEGSMIGLMSDTMAPQELRMKALSAMAENMTQQNVSVIKNSLSEKDDEIRLYSFSLIDKMEHGINNKIHDASTRYKNKKDEKERLKAAKELAFLYWEMIYFDLSDDVLKSFLTDESYKYAKVCSRADMSDADINILLGKIYLSKKDYEKATTQFVMAIESGADYAYMLPYLAELYFKRGNYKSIRAMFSKVDKLNLNATMHPVIGQWRMHG
ncbi:MAG: hypothetical protein COA44_01985 [Arcobacter sp.]|nr:MAG: hypothetical protein COA44_01985 [Arcobacter sp.]